MSAYLSSSNFPSRTPEEAEALERKLATLLREDCDGDLYPTLGRYQRLLANNLQRAQWPAIHDKLRTLFMCGSPAVLDGPMVGIPVSIRDSDFFKGVAEKFGRSRSLQASIEVMASAWNATFADTGLWMGKTFEPVSREVVEQSCGNDPEVMAAYDEATTRIGRNFFREPPNPDLIQGLGLPTLIKAWHLIDRPATTGAPGFKGTLLQRNLEKERHIPYTKTGGIYLAQPGPSVVPEMNGKQVYSLNYRWPNLRPAFPMSCLIDEIVQIGEGIYLGQLVFATQHFSLGAIDLPLLPDNLDPQLGEPYAPNRQTMFESIKELVTGKEEHHAPDYGYQNNGFFLMMDPAFAQKIYADRAFPQLRPRAGEAGYTELGYDQLPPPRAPGEEQRYWISGWQEDETLQRKFTTLITEPSPNPADEAVEPLLQPGESVLQMLQRISRDISAQTTLDDHLHHFEKLHRLFRHGVAPRVANGLFQGAGKGYNVRANGKEARDWYGEEEISEGFDYYHGANLNLHWGFGETFCPDRKTAQDESTLFPGALASALLSSSWRGPNLLNMVWHSIGKYIFPWAGKSFERISPRKLSMFLDESSDLAKRYPARVEELKHHLASAPHYELVKKSRDGYWREPGRYAPHLTHAWDQGMAHADKEFWQREADARWVMGYNTQDKRILAADALMRLADMNYRTPDHALQQLSVQSSSPFERQGYIFLGLADQESILPMNNGSGSKRVFQFHYRYPMIGGPAPIGFCLDELVEIAEGLFLGQLIYSTALHVPFRSTVPGSEYKYQLFGYFLLLDDEWERHRQAIGLDTLD